MAISAHGLFVAHSSIGCYQFVLQCKISVVTGIVGRLNIYEMLFFVAHHKTGNTVSQALHWRGFSINMYHTTRQHINCH